MKPKTVSQPFSPEQITAAKAAPPAGRRAVAIDWSKAVVTRGGGVAATIDAIKPTSQPKKRAPRRKSVA